MDLKSGVELAANAATAAGLVIGVIGALIAYRSFSAQRIATRDSHLHAAFRAHLEAELAYGTDPKLAGRLVVLKLYTLEEMQGAVLGGRQDLSGLQGHLMGRRARDRAARSLRSWEETILSHLEGDDVALENIRQRLSCYGVEFLRLLAERARLDEAFKADINAHLLASAKGRERPADPSPFDWDERANETG